MIRWWAGKTVSTDDSKVINYRVAYLPVLRSANEILWGKHADKWFVARSCFIIRLSIKQDDGSRAPERHCGAEKKTLVVDSNRSVYFAVLRSDLNCWWHNGLAEQNVEATIIFHQNIYPPSAVHYEFPDKHVTLANRLSMKSVALCNALLYAYICTMNKKQEFQKCV